MNNLFSVLAVLMLSSAVGFAQSTNELSPGKESTNGVEYHIGIGNEEESLFNEVLANLQSDAAIVVNKFCTSDRKISFTVMNNTYKSYDIIKNELISLTPELVLLRKSNGIYSNQCELEQLKN